MKKPQRLAGSKEEKGEIAHTHTFRNENGMKRRKKFYSK